MDGCRPGPPRLEPRGGVQWRSEMALNLSQKQNVVAEVAKWPPRHTPDRSQYAGTTVEQMTAMRKKAREPACTESREEHAGRAP